MQLEQAMRLIRHAAIDRPGITQWADLGCGSGLFTQALAGLLQPGSTIYAIDKDISGFKKFPSSVSVKTLQLDFVQDKIDLNNLDGILMANALHYVKNKPAFINKLKISCKENNCMLVVEYDTHIANPWVPYPVSFSALQALFNDNGYAKVEKIQETASLYGRANIYGAIIYN